MVMKEFDPIKDVPVLREKYKSLLGSMGLTAKVNPGSRFFQAFDLIEGYGVAAAAGRKQLDAFLDSHNSNHVVRTAYGEVFELARMVDLLESDDTIVAEAIVKASSGKLEAIDEADSSPRNFQYQLALYADLKRSGMNVRMCSPNPDIQVACGATIYDIECKRLSSPRRFDDNVRGASHQLKKLLAASAPNHFGIFAISIAPVFSEPVAHLDASTLDAANARFGSDFRKFAQNNFSSWTKPSRLLGRRIPAILLHQRVSVLTRELHPPVQRVAANLAYASCIGEQAEEYTQFLKDFKPYFQQAGD